MNSRLLAGLLPALLSATALAQAPSPAPDSPLSAWLQGRDARLVDWLPDGTLLITTRFGQTRQLHRVLGPLAQREQLSFQDAPVDDALPGPRSPGQWLQMESRGDGSYRLRTAAKDQWPATVLAPGWVSLQRPVRAHDGQRIAFGGMRDSGDDPGLTVLDPRLPTAPQRACPGARVVQAQDWSHDDERVLLIETTGTDTSVLQVCDLASGKLTRLEPDAGTAAAGTRVTAAQFSRDGRGAYFVTTHGEEFAQLRYVDQYTRQAKVVARSSGADIGQLLLSTDGRWLAWTVAEPGGDRLAVRDLTGQRDLALAPLPPGAVIDRMAFDASGNLLALGVESAQSASEVLVYTLTAPATWQAWTRSEQGPLPALPRAVPQPFAYATWDSDERGARQVPAWLYAPTGPGPHPVLVELPGGHGERWQPRWDPLLQHLVTQQGWAVIVPQLRGSAGYGRSWQALDNGRLRDDPLRDLAALLVWIGLQPDLDPRRVVLWGEGLGAHQALSAMALLGERLAGAVTVGGFARHATWLDSLPGWQRQLLRAELGDDRDSAIRELLERSSPLPRSGSIRSPLLLAVPPSGQVADELQTLADRVRANDVEVTVVSAPQPGPSWPAKDARDAWWQAVADFLGRRAAAAP